MLRDKLGAELVESVDPLYPDDPSVPNMQYTFQDAFAEVLPHTVPEYFFQKTPKRRAGVRRAGLGRDDGRVPRRAGDAQGAAVAEAHAAADQLQARQPAQHLRDATGTSPSAATRA